MRPALVPHSEDLDAPGHLPWRIVDPKLVVPSISLKAQLGKLSLLSRSFGDDAPQAMAWNTMRTWLGTGPWGDAVRWFFESWRHSMLQRQCAWCYAIFPSHRLIRCRKCACLLCLPSTKFHWMSDEFQKLEEEASNEVNSCVMDMYWVVCLTCD